YRGVIVWNKSQKIIRRGKRAQRWRGRDQWYEIPAPELRMIDDALWQQVQARLAQAAEAFARRVNGKFLTRRGRLDGESPYLLTGLLKCGAERPGEAEGICGAAVGGITQLHGVGKVAEGKRTRKMFYGCSFHRKRGEAICTNDHVLACDL